MKNKNLRLLLGRSLLQRAIEAAQKVSGIKSVIVSTDSETIADAARKGGAETPFRRPSELASDSAPEWLAWRHAIDWMHHRYGRNALERFVSVPTTAPLRLPSDIDQCIQLHEQGGCDVVLTVRPAERSPYFNMVSLGEDMTVALAAKPAHSIAHRQKALQLYDVTTIAYVASPDFIMSASGIFEGKVKAIVVPKERAVDIDDEWDLLTAEVYLRRLNDCGLHA